MSPAHRARGDLQGQQAPGATCLAGPGGVLWRVSVVCETHRLPAAVILRSPPAEVDGCQMWPPPRCERKHSWRQGERAAVAGLAHLGNTGPRGRLRQHPAS